MRVREEEYAMRILWMKTLKT